MRFGVCCGPNEFENVKNAGYDYIEMNFSNLCGMTVQQFNEAKSALEHYNFKAEAFNGFFSGDFVLVGDNRTSLKRIEEYAKLGFSRASEIGGEIAVVGSGAARRIPENYDEKTAREEFKQVLRVCGKVAAEFGMKIAVEPLNTDETNMINKVSECLELVREIGDSNIGCLADFYHMYRANERPSVLNESSPHLFHIHLARAKDDRSMPTKEDKADIIVLAQALKAAGYNDRISLEGYYLPDLKTAINNTFPLLKIFNER